MGIVIGPIDVDTWYTMRELRESVRYMKSADPNKFRLAINKETEVFNELLQGCAKAA